MLSGQFEKAYAILDSWEEDKTLVSMVLRAWLLNYEGKFVNALEQINEAIYESNKQANMSMHFHGIVIKTNLLLKLGKIPELNELYNECIRKIQEFDDVLLKQTIWARAYFYNYYAFMKVQSADWEDAFKTLDKSQVLFDEINDKFGNILVSSNRAYFYKLKGDLVDALTIFQKAYVDFRDLGYSFGIALCLSNIGDIMRLRGQPVKAKDYIIQALDLFLQDKGNPSPHIVAETYRRLGRILILLNDQKNAKINLNLALEHVKIGPLPVRVAEITLDLTLLAIEEGNKDEVENGILKLRALHANDPNNKQIEVLLKFVVGRNSLKFKKGIKGIVDAQQVFEEIIDEEIISHEITVLSIIHLLEILFIEMKAIQNKDTLIRINIYITKIFKIAKEQYSIALLIELHILKSRIALLTLNNTEISNHLEIALTLAKENKIAILQNKVENERSELTKHIRSLNKMVEFQQSLHSNIDEINILEYLAEVSKVVRTL